MENLRAQSAHFLKVKSDEAARLAAELASHKAKSEAEIAALRAEVDHVAAYAEKVCFLNCFCWCTCL